MIRIMNKEELSEYNKKYYTTTSEKKKTYNKKYYQRNKAYWTAKSKEKVLCECGRTISLFNTTSHKKTAIHKRLLQHINNQKNN
jgi:hypothetical protein